MSNRTFAAGLAAGAVALLLLFAVPRANADNYSAVSGGTYWEVAAPGANTDAITDLTWRGQGFPRVTVQVDTGTVVNLMVSRGGTENALGLNGNTALTAGCVYVFDVPGVRSGDILNIQVETDSAIPMLEIGQVRSNR